MKVKTINFIANMLTLITGITALFYVLKFQRSWRDITLTLAGVATAFNAWAFYKQLQRNKKRGFLYYLQPEWQNKTASGWVNPFNPASNLATLVGYLWLFLLVVVFEHPNYYLLRLLLILTTIVGSMGWVYSTYKFETATKIYQDTSPFYLWGLLGQFGIAISFITIAAVFIFIREPTIYVFYPVIVVTLLSLVRFLLPQRYFGPKAVRKAYKKAGKAGFLWSQKLSS